MMEAGILRYVEEGRLEEKVFVFLGHGVKKISGYRAE